MEQLPEAEKSKEQPAAVPEKTEGLPAPVK
jgi:hypothetical protein